MHARWHVICDQNKQHAVECTLKLGSVSHRAKEHYDTFGTSCSWYRNIIYSISRMKFPKCLRHKKWYTDLQGLLKMLLSEMYFNAFCIMCVTLACCHTWMGHNLKVLKDQFTKYDILSVISVDSLVWLLLRHMESSLRVEEGISLQFMMME